MNSQFTPSSKKRTIEVSLIEVHGLNIIEYKKLHTERIIKNNQNKRLNKNT